MKPRHAGGMRGAIAALAARIFGPAPRRPARDGVTAAARLIAFAVATVTLTNTAFAAALAPVTAKEVDAIFATWDKAGSPGVALAVIHDGKIIYERGYGRADIERDTPIAPSTVFYVGSVSKQFAAASIALLAQRGALSLDDNVKNYVPELPDYEAPITIRQLIHHTSGLRDYLALRDIAGESGEATFGDDAVLALLRQQKALNFAPGTRHLYSNSGYFLLSLIVKRTTAKSLRTFAQEEIFGPLGMKTALFRDDHTMTIADRANGYAPIAARPGTYRVSNPNFDVVGAGGVFMTVRDFLAWDQNFYDAEIGGADFVAQLQTPGKLNDGTPLTYAFGLTVGTYRDLRIVEHGGAYGGFRAHVLRFPAQRTSVVCFTNLSTMVPGRLAREVADLYLGNVMGPAARAAGASAPPPTGNVGSGALPDGAARKGKATVAKTSGATAATKSAEELSAFAGDYFSAELQVTWRIVAQGNALLLLRDAPNATLLRLARKDGNSFTVGGLTLNFSRSGESEAASFTVDESRARGLIFRRR